MEDFERNREEWVEEYAEGIGDMIAKSGKTEQMKKKNEELGREIQQAIKKGEKYEEYAKNWSNELSRAVGGVTPRLLKKVLEDVDISEEDKDKIWRKFKEKTGRAIEDIMTRKAKKLEKEV